ncbi:MAG: sensor histidine kinase [Acidimicrobiales bacterium]
MPGSSSLLSHSSSGASLGQAPWALVAGAPFTRRSWRELLYALVTVPLGVFGFAFVVASLFFGVWLSVVLVGFLLFALSTLGVLKLGALNRDLVRRFLGEEVPPPPPFRPRPGVIGWIRSGIVDRAGWRARAYLVLKFPLALASLIAVITLRIASLWFVLAPAQWAADVGTEKVRGDAVAHRYVINFGSFYFDSWQRTLLLTAIGVTGWWLAPWVLRAILYLDRHLLADLLGPMSLPSRVRQLERARAGAVDEASTRLRRLERDLHDGAQAELVGLAMKLGLAQEKLAQAQQQHGSPEVAQARRLVDDAHDRADTALRQLRDLSRGIHPSELEQGLQAALATLAARSPLPAHATVTLTERPSPAIEEIVYFCAAELAANAAKHSGGSAVSLQLAQDGDVLRLTVTDDGVGGALIAGNGLSGLAERLSTVDGQLKVASPPGGPTVLTVELPARP